MTEPNPENFRVLIVSHAFPPEKGGNASRMGDLYKYLLKFGINVSVLAPIETYPFGAFPKRFQLVKYDGGVVRLFTYQPKKDASYVERILYYTIFPILASLWIVFHKNIADVVLVTSPPPQMYLVVLVAKLLRKKVVVDIRDLFLDVSSSLGFIKPGGTTDKIFRFLEFKALRIADAVTTVTPRIRRQLIERYTIDPFKCHVVPNGVDLETFRCRDSQRILRIVYTGYFGYAQDFDTFLEGYSLLEQKYRVPIILAGSGEALERTLRKVKLLGLSQFVEYLGVLSREEIVSLLCSSGIGISPIKVDKSLEYAVPSKIYEYLACGIPFIGVGIGEIERVAKESRAGCVGKSPQEIAACIKKLLNSNLKKMSVYGLRYAAFHSRENSARKFLRVLISTVRLDDG